MAGNTWVARAEMSDADIVAAMVRPADSHEVHASSGWAVIEALRWGIEHGETALTGWSKEGPLCVFGVTQPSVLTNHGVPWLISTTLVERYQLSFLRNSKPYFEAMRSRFDSLSNYVDDRHTVAQRWLRWLGFAMGPPQPYGVYGLPFRRFWWSRSMAGVNSHV